MDASKKTKTNTWAINDSTRGGLFGTNAFSGNLDTDSNVDKLAIYLDVIAKAIPAKIREKMGYAGGSSNIFSSMSGGMQHNQYGNPTMGGMQMGGNFGGLGGYSPNSMLNDASTQYVSMLTQYLSTAGCAEGMSKNDHELRCGIIIEQLDVNELSPEALNYTPNMGGFTNGLQNFMQSFGSGTFGGGFGGTQNQNISVQQKLTHVNQVSQKINELIMKAMTGSGTNPEAFQELYQAAFLATQYNQGFMSKSFEYSTHLSVFNQEHRPAPQRLVDSITDLSKQINVFYNAFKSGVSGSTLHYTAEVQMFGTLVDSQIKLFLSMVGPYLTDSTVNDPAQAAATMQQYGVDISAQQLQDERNNTRDKIFGMYGMDTPPPQQPQQQYQQQYQQPQQQRQAYNAPQHGTFSQPLWPNQQPQQQYQQPAPQATHAQGPTVAQPITSAQPQPEVVSLSEIQAELAS